MNKLIMICWVFTESGTTSNCKSRINAPYCNTFKYSCVQHMHACHMMCRMICSGGVGSTVFGIYRMYGMTSSRYVNMIMGTLMWDYLLY